MKNFIHLLALMLFFVAAPTMALQMGDISPSLTRTQADRTLPKNYTYKVLDDFTVRRTWVLSSDKRVSLDFNPQNDKLLMVLLEYGIGIDPQKAAADVRRITGAGKTKWKRMTRKKAEKYDVPVNTNNAKSGSCYAFMEMTKSNKCKKVMIYTSLPDSNRTRLGEANTAFGTETALGTGAGVSMGKVIAEQEAKRKSTPLATDSSPAAVRRDTVAPPQEKNTQQTETDETDSEETEEIVDDFEEIKVESRFSLSSIQATIGLQGVSPVVLIGGAIAVVVLLTIIGMLKGTHNRKRLSRYRSGRY